MMEGCTLQLNLALFHFAKKGSTAKALRAKESQKLDVETFKDPTECTLAPNDHQNGAKVVPQGAKMPPKWCPRSMKIQKFEWKSA